MKDAVVLWRIVSVGRLISVHHSERLLGTGGRAAMTRLPSKIDCSSLLAVAISALPPVRRSSQTQPLLDFREPCGSCKQTIGVIIQNHECTRIHTNKTSPQWVCFRKGAKAPWISCFQSAGKIFFCPRTENENPGSLEPFPETAFFS